MLQRGPGGYPPASPILEESEPVWEHRQCLLDFSKSPEGDLRVLGCLGSLFKTHTGVIACECKS